MREPIRRLSEVLEGRYRVLRELGEGGMSTVYLALDLRHGRNVALKVLRPELAAVMAGRRFLGEIRTTANLHHPHILPLFDSGEADGYLYYVMPHVEGESLRDRLRRDGQLSVEEAVRITTDLAEALGYAHRQGVVHRDIKPGNVLLHDGQAVISDFGIALAVDAAGGNRVTGTGQSVGTPYYMSPEQAAPSGDVDARSDVYSLACVLHEMLTGEPVFTGPTPRSVLAKHLTVPPIPVRALRSAVPAGIERAVLRALEKTPADRFSTMEEFVRALESGASAALSPRALWTAGTAFLRAHPVAATAAALIVAGTLAVTAPFFSAPAWTERPSSVAVLPFRGSTTTDEEAALAIELADLVGRELRGWDGVSVATDMELAGPRRSMGLTDPALERIGDGAALAEAVDAEAMLTLTVRQRDSVVVEASLWDARSRRRVGVPVMTGGLAEDVRRPRFLVPVVAGVLGFGDAPDPNRAMGAGTRNPEAARAYLWGRQELERNRLDEAERRFTQAVQLDSTFASALSFLAQSHFWQGVQEGYVDSHGPAISRWSTAATRHVRGLSRPSEAHVQAFHALQVGDLEEARNGYRSAVESDPSDAYAWLMLGEIELRDRWSVRTPDGSLVPRSNLNRSRRAFAQAIGIEPAFELAYGRIFAVHGELAAGLNGQCDGFEEVGDAFRPIWRRQVLNERVYPLCAVARDSLEWVTLAELRSADRGVLRAGADRVFQQAVNGLEQWASFAPDQPRPHELLSDAYVRRRRQLPLAAPQRHEAAAAEALRHASQALSLKPDTLPADLARSASLYLAAGDRDRAVDFARRALANYAEAGSDVIVGAPDELINVLVATGQTSAALAVASGLPSGARYITDPETGEGIPYGSAATRVMARLRVLGASGIDGGLLRKELSRLGDAWIADGHPDRWRLLLREANTVAIASSLVLDSSALADWSRSVEVDDPVWMALTLGGVDPTGAAEAFQRAQASLSREAGPGRTFLLATAARRLGRAADALALYARMDSIPHRVDVFDPGWGLRGLSHLRRAETYEQLGDTAAAIEHLERFIAEKSWPDSLSTPLLEQAERSLAALEGS